MLDQLQPKAGSTHSKKRVGRGNGSGWGGTSGKGHKGQKARSGGKVRVGFEGGQTPLMRRLPKFGFTNTQFKTTYTIINLKDLSRYGTEIDPIALADKGVMKANGLLKILGDGELTSAVTVKAHKFSKSAKEAIEKAGGKAEVL